ncbi:MAG: hypothetical protein DWQ07_17830 [Chloroflexi bacterium]|nr:MAG: hypothetical protein DWQ07_17830 [Chloroflexota bacterium]
MNKKTYIALLAFGAAIILGACSITPDASPTTEIESETTSEPTESSMANMGTDSSMSSQDFAPLVGGIYEDGEVLFIHTETSDPDVATLLTEMMAGPVVVLVPELANAPSELLAKVYVFTNGLEGHGPFGFQQDIFDSVPGDEEYRPLRAINLVEWNSIATPRELRSLAELLAAEADGEVTITQPGIVVNMPILSWPDGHR